MAIAHNATQLPSNNARFKDWRVVAYGSSNGSVSVHESILQSVKTRYKFASSGCCGAPECPFIINVGPITTGTGWDNWSTAMTNVFGSTLQDTYSNDDNGKVLKYLCGYGVTDSNGWSQNLRGQTKNYATSLSNQARYFSTVFNNATFVFLDGSTVAAAENAEQRNFLLSVLRNYSTKWLIAVIRQAFSTNNAVANAVHRNFVIPLCSHGCDLILSEGRFGVSNKVWPHGTYTFSYENDKQGVNLVTCGNAGGAPANSAFNAIISNDNTGYTELLIKNDVIVISYMDANGTTLCNTSINPNYKDHWAYNSMLFQDQSGNIYFHDDGKWKKFNCLKKLIVTHDPFFTSPITVGSISSALNRWNIDFTCKFRDKICFAGLMGSHQYRNNWPGFLEHVYWDIEYGNDHSKDKKMVRFRNMHDMNYYLNEPENFSDSNLNISGSLRLIAHMIVDNDNMFVKDVDIHGFQSMTASMMGGKTQKQALCGVSPGWYTWNQGLIDEYALHTRLLELIGVTDPPSVSEGDYIVTYQKSGRDLYNIPKPGSHNAGYVHPAWSDLDTDDRAYVYNEDDNTISLLDAQTVTPSGAIGHFTVTASPYGNQSGFNSTLNGILSKLPDPGAFHVTAGNFGSAADSRQQIDGMFGSNFTWYPLIGAYEAMTIAPTGSYYTASGGTIYYDGTDAIHVFTDFGFFNTIQDLKCQILVVGGGGGCGYCDYASAPGGGGGVVYQSDYIIPAGSHIVTIGAGGVGASSLGAGGNGGDSVFEDITAVGGGGGGGGDSVSDRSGQNGGSGGGGCYESSGGLGTVGQGYDGGSGSELSGAAATGGGGGAGGVGADGTVNAGGAGGDGIACNITGTIEFYGGGGGGGTTTDADAAVGGIGGGGNGNSSGSDPGGAGTDGEDGKGGGAGGGPATPTALGFPALNGGSGIVIIRYSRLDVQWLRAEYETGNSTRTPLKESTLQNGPSGSVETTYSVDYENAHLVFINEFWDGNTVADSDIAADGNVVTALQEWLEADLKASTKPIKIVFGNEAAFVPYGWNHYGESLDKHEENRDAFWEILRSNGVTAMISGYSSSVYQMQVDGVWQIDAGNAGNDVNNDGYTFIDVIIGNTFIEFDFWRDQFKTGDWVKDSNIFIQLHTPILFHIDETKPYILMERSDDDTLLITDSITDENRPNGYLAKPRAMALHLVGDGLYDNLHMFRIKPCGINTILLDKYDTFNYIACISRNERFLEYVNIDDLIPDTGSNRYRRLELEDLISMFNFPLLNLNTTEALRSIKFLTMNTVNGAASDMSNKSVELIRRHCGIDVKYLIR
jgi:hypothetical protein